MRETLNIMGVIDVPILADLPLGFKLVAHPNGPGIATEQSIFTLACAGRGELPQSVAVEAIEAYEGLTWPLLEAQLKNSAEGEVNDGTG